MIGGYMGKILFVNLSTGDITEETPDESLYRDYMGGYGIGAKILYDRLKPGEDPLGPGNIFGIVTGPLTGTPTPTGTRYCAVGKSPLTGGWGDANSGGHFAPNLKFAGYDAVFFTGASDKPVYLYIDNGKAEIRDAGHLWGKDNYETEDILKDEHGKDVECISIGPSGEKLALIACIINDRGAAAGRSGLGAVMGSKKLKAIAAKGSMEVPLADKARADKLRSEYVEGMKKPGPGGMTFADNFGKYGTSGSADRSALSGDTPVKNWGGVGVVEIPDASGLAGDKAIANVARRAGCWHCPIACESRLKEGTGEYKYPAGIRRAEYETQGSFGALLCNTNHESINMATHICNSYGLDTISAGSIISFAIECYENGILTKEDTDGIELTWGNHKAIIAILEKMAKREGLGDILADGVKVAAEKIGKGSEKYAVHIGGQELGMHDPKLPMFPGQAAASRYLMDATPGRHTQEFGTASSSQHLTNVAGLCLFYGMGAGPDGARYTQGFLAAATGLERSMEELEKIGERVGNLRHAFNLREGINQREWVVHPRIIGDPPQTEGPLAGVKIDLDEELDRTLKELDWDIKTTKPSKEKLLELGLDFVAKDLY